MTWVYAIYCLGVFNACQGYYRTEANPQISFAIESEEKCRVAATRAAQIEKFTNPHLNIVWRCIDISKTTVTEDRRDLTNALSH